MAVVSEAPLTAAVAHVVAAFDALASHHCLGSSLHRQLEFADELCPLFVSWHKRSRLGGDSRLRGCIGTLEARPLRTALVEFALTSALRDKRFPPIEASELPRLCCTVSLLSCFEPAASWEDWEVGTHGLVIEFVEPHSGARRTATFLPEVAANEGWTKQQTVDHLIRKAGYDGAAVLVRDSASLKVTRYQSTTCTLTFDDWAKQSSREPLKLKKQHQMVAVAAGD